MIQSNSSLSLILPTKCRKSALVQHLDSIAATAFFPEKIEVSLVIDACDDSYYDLPAYPFGVLKTFVPIGLPMGKMNSLGYARCSGSIIMLSNDDVVMRTLGWDREIFSLFSRFQDEIFLFHANDLLFGEKLCCFPVVSRVFCELVGGISDPRYLRYCIDDHIFDIFNLLLSAGYRRSFYYPEIIFEHLNFNENDSGMRDYRLDSGVHSKDWATFKKLRGDRVKQAGIIIEHIVKSL